MLASVRNSALLASLLAASQPLAAGTNGVFLPTAPQGSGGEDSIETAEGTRCRQSVNSSGPYADVGVTGRAASELPQSSAGPLLAYQQDRDREALVYARITIPLGKRPQRIDCTRLYELEIARLKQQVELLSMAAQ